MNYWKWYWYENKEPYLVLIISIPICFLYLNYMWFLANWLGRDVFPYPLFLEWISSMIFLTLLPIIILLIILHFMESFKEYKSKNLTKR